MDLVKILPFVRGLFRSETIRFNGLFLAVWTWAVESGLVSQLLEANPNIMSVLVYAATIINMVLRAKTDTSLTER